MRIVLFSINFQDALTKWLLLIYSVFMENTHKKDRGGTMIGMAGQIEILRQQLLETVDRCSGDFLHPSVLRVSQELDELIVQFQQLQRLEHLRRREPTI
ncbi:hypothetical protein EL26_18105 [Tumebacillus flagellatus]|uniref:Sporulation protein Spo0E n=2 Tax=Tumebacillus flagellatus TaxID=1157490 RepID=A0A074LI95_9BACL|nr:hypothetical protein EL26_18105 [Tumebacillus flagellatus]